MYKKVCLLSCFLLIFAIIGANSVLAAEINVRISSSSDDAEEHLSDGSMDITSSDLEMPYEDAGPADKQQVGLRFQNIELLKGATITNAYLEFEVDSVSKADSSDAVSVIIQGEKSGNAAEITSDAKNLSNRTLTTASVAWSIPAWTVVSEKFQSSDISSVIQEIVNQSSWESGNTLLLSILDDPANPSAGLREAESYDGEDENAPLLHIEFLSNAATVPNPENGAVEISVDIDLSWESGIDAYTHILFLGTDFNSVANATLNDTLGTVCETLDVNSYEPGRLEYGTTYYWRVDEVSEPPDTTVYKGKIWSFTTELEGYELAAENVVGVEFNSTMDVYENQEPNTTYNGAGLDDVNGTHSNDGTTMWVGASENPGEVWLQYELDQVYKLYQLKIWNYNDATYKDFGAKDVNVLYSIDNVTWKALDEIQVFPMATGESTYKADIFVDMNGALAKYVKLSFLSSYFDDLYTGGISEIRFLAIPTRAASPSPADDDADVDVDSILSWKAGRDAAMHKIYIDSDEESVISGNADIIYETVNLNYPIVLDLGKTYYWRVDEVNEAEEYTIWNGPVWKFSTQQSVLIDGFESGYGNNVNTNAVFLTWKDGDLLGDSSNGSWMGRKSEPYLQTINHSGGHSAPMQYDNSSKSYSEVKAETSKLLNGPDWSKGNPGALVIWFMSDANDVNEPVLDRLYVKIDSTKKVYNGPDSHTRRTAWTKWEVPLTGISLGNVTSITIGVERIGSTGGMGTLYLDDIMLTPVSPLQPAAVNPGTDGLLARYSMENNVQDSSGSGLNGTLSGTANGGLTYADGLAGFGKALVFDGNDDCVDLGKLEAFNFEGSFSISLWAKMDAWSTNWGNVMISNRGESTGGGWQIRRYTDNTVCFTTRGVGTSQDDTNTNFHVALKEWNNITCVYDSEAYTKSIYINGVLDRTVNLDGTVTKVTATTTKTYIGARSNSGNTGLDSGNFFKGAIDQIIIYNRALSASEAAFLGDPTP